MLKFKPARHDPGSFGAQDLDPVTGLVQSLRWFASRSSLLLYLWSMHQTIETEYKNPSSLRPLPPDVMFMLRRSILYSLILELRALHDRDAKSLGGAQIQIGLSDATSREGLREYMRDFVHVGSMPESAEREAYLDYVQRYSALMSAPDKRSTLNDHPLSAKIQLVRRMANKSVAHATLDEYMLGGEDLHDAVLATVTIASAITAVLGSAAISDDFAELESLGYRAAGLLLNVEVDASPHTVNMIRSLLPGWVKLGTEFPRYPDDFNSMGRTADHKP